MQVFLLIYLYCIMRRFPLIYRWVYRWIYLKFLLIRFYSNVKIFHGAKNVPVDRNRFAFCFLGQKYCWIMQMAIAWKVRRFLVEVFSMKQKSQVNSSLYTIHGSFFYTPVEEYRLKTYNLLIYLFTGRGRNLIYLYRKWRSS